MVKEDRDYYDDELLKFPLSLPSRHKNLNKKYCHALT